ncbi:MAG: hypothetical protein NT154_23815, partial [Verrucomicrobia bacterium]|nr:hypothetical protein [Verrucomicrobiota bacterium]
MNWTYDTRELRATKRAAWISRLTGAARPTGCRAATLLLLASLAGPSVASCGLLLLLTPSAQGSTLTGIIVFDSYAPGGMYASGGWNTRGGDAAFNLYLLSGGSFINGGDASISIPMEVGNYCYAWRGSGGPLRGSVPDINLYFNSDGAPRISCASSALIPFGGTTYTLGFAYGVPAANSLAYDDGTVTVTLTAVTLSSSGTDLVGGGSVGPDGRSDCYGTICLTVAPSAAGEIVPLDQLGGAADNQQTVFDRGGERVCQPKQGLPSHSINTSFLNLVVEDTDLAYRSYGHTVALRRVWNMVGNATGMFGNGWSGAYESSLRADNYTTNGTAKVALGSGQVQTYAVVSKEGSGVMTLQYARSDGSFEPMLTGFINETNQTGYYLLGDSTTWLTNRYDYAREDTVSGTHLYRLSSITDHNGNALTVGYDSSGRLAMLTDGSGRTILFTYDANNRCHEIVHFDGGTIRFQYDAAGNLIQSVDLANTVSTYGYGSRNFMTSLTSAGRTTTFTYATNSLHQPYVAAVTDASGQVWGYAWVSVRAQVTEPGGGTRIYTSLGGRTSRVTDALMKTNYFEYLDGLLAKRTDPLGAVTRYSYSRGKLVRQINPDATELADGYDEQNRLVAWTDELGQATAFTHDASGNLIGTTKPSGRHMDWTYDGRGCLLTQRDPDANTTCFTYDAHGNLASVLDPEGYRVCLGYDTNGLNLVAATNALGYVMQLTWDANRRPLKTIYPDSTFTERLYDCCAPSGLRDENGQEWTIMRDALQRPIQIIDPLGGVVIETYNPRGNLTSIQDAEGRAHAYDYDQANRLTAVSNALGVASGVLAYDANNNLMAVQAGSFAATLAYDVRQRLTHWGRGTTGATVYGYDAAGQFTSLTNRRSQAFGFDYDPDGRLLRKTQDGTTLAEYGYTRSGALLGMTDPIGTTVFDYDRRQLVTNIAYPDGLSVAMQYDALGRLTALDYPGGLRVNYAYDSRDRVTNLTWSGQAMTFGYDGAGRLLSETRANGSSSQYGYNAAGRLINLVHQLPANLLVQLRYDRDASGEVTNVVKVSGMLPMRPPFAAATNTFSTTLPGFAETWNGVGVNYDLDGNRTGFGDPAVDPASYDAENRLLSFARGTNSAAYTYDGLGRMARAVRNGQERRCHYDHAGRLLFETDAGGA